MNKVFYWWHIWRCRKVFISLRLLVLDVDGVLTDGGLWYGSDGELAKRFDVRDGLGIKLLQKAGVEIAFLSGGRSGAIEARAKHLGIRHCLVSVSDKVVGISTLIEAAGVKRHEVGFVGDDLNDLVVRPSVGLLVATADAVKPLRRESDLVLIRKGGNGAVRELAECILKARGNWAEFSRFGWRERND